MLLVSPQRVSGEPFPRCLARKCPPRCFETQGPSRMDPRFALHGEGLGHACSGCVARTV